MNGEKITGAEIVLKALQDQGVEVIFGYPGGAVLPIYDEIFRQEISSELTSKTCDFNNNGNIDNNDYQIWKSNLNN